MGRFNKSSVYNNSVQKNESVNRLLIFRVYCRCANSPKKYCILMFVQKQAKHCKPNILKFSFINNSLQLITTTATSALWLILCTNVLMQFEIKEKVTYQKMKCVIDNTKKCECVFIVLDVKKPLNVLESSYEVNIVKVTHRNYYFTKIKYSKRYHNAAYFPYQ